jgi:hypothetical protein
MLHHHYSSMYSHVYLIAIPMVTSYHLYYLMHRFIYYSHLYSVMNSMSHPLTSIFYSSKPQAIILTSYSASISTSSFVHALIVIFFFIRAISKAFYLQ